MGIHHPNTILQAHIVCLSVQSTLVENKAVSEHVVIGIGGGDGPVRWDLRILEVGWVGLGWGFS